MAEKKETKTAEAQAPEVAVAENKTPETVSEAQKNPEKFLKDFNWHNYEEGIDPVEDSQLEEFEKLSEEVLNQETVNLLLSEAISSVKNLKDQAPSKL